MDLGIFLLAAGCVLIPVILTLTGLVALRVARCDAGRVWAAPLAGSAVWCIVGTYSIMTWAPPWLWCMGLIAIVIGVAAYYRGELAFRAPELGIYALTYLFTLGVMCIVPFPGMWLMGGDWMQHYGMAEAVWERAFGAGHLARSPAYAAGAIVCLPFRPGLAAYQVYVAATTAAAMMVLVVGARTRAALARRRWAIACLALSAFYIVHLQNLWPKWLAAGLFVAAILEALRHRERGELSAALLALVWFGAGVAVHESTAFAFVFLLVAFGRPALAALCRMRGMWAAAIAIGLLTFAGWQVWTLAAHGLSARIAEHPIRTWHEVRPLHTRLGMNALDHLAGLLPANLRARWSAPGVTNSSEQIAGNLYYTAIALNTWMAATLLTILGPTLWVLRAEIRVLWRDAMRAGEVRGWAVALAVTLLLNCLAGPTSPPYGLAQAGFTQVCLLGFVSLVLRLLDRAPAVRLRRMARWHLLTGFAPFVVLALGVLLVTRLHHPGAVALAEKLRAVDADLWTVRNLGLEPLAEVFFPGGLVVFVLATAAFWSGAVRVSGQNVRAKRE